MYILFLIYVHILNVKLLQDIIILLKCIPLLLHHYDKARSLCKLDLYSHLWSVNIFQNQNQKHSPVRLLARHQGNEEHLSRDAREPVELLSCLQGHRSAFSSVGQLHLDLLLKRDLRIF